MKKYSLFSLFCVILITLNCSVIFAAVGNTPSRVIYHNYEDMVIVNANNVQWQYNAANDTWSATNNENGKKIPLKDNFYLLFTKQDNGEVIHNAYYFDENGTMCVGWLFGLDGRIYYLEHRNKNILGNLLPDSVFEIEGIVYVTKNDGSIIVDNNVEDFYNAAMSSKVVGEISATNKPNVSNVPSTASANKSVSPESINDYNVNEIASAKIERNVPTDPTQYSKDGYKSNFNQADINALKQALSKVDAIQNEENISSSDQKAMAVNKLKNKLKNK